MQSAAAFALVLVTAPRLPVARRIARLALERRLVACANLIPGIESHYRWQGRIESAREALLVLKTRRSLLARLERLITAEHPYDTPEFLALPLNQGTRRYLAWLAASADGAEPDLE